MRRAYKFLLRPTSRQERLLLEMLEDHRQLYNAALEERREAWRMRKVCVWRKAQAAQLKDIRAADPDGQGRWSSMSQQATLLRLEWTFNGFFRRVKAGEKAGYPRFQGRRRFDSVTWPIDRNGCKWDSVPHPTVTRLYLKGVGHVRVHQHRAVKGRIKTITVRREADRWHVMLACDDVPAEPLPATGSEIGIDLGIVHFLTTSGGGHVPNPRPLDAISERLTEAQRALRRRKPGSRGRRAAVRRIGALHGKARRARLDHAHKTALRLVREHDLIVHEDLALAHMTRRPAPRPAGDGMFEPNGAAAKAGLNRSIEDAGWGIFLKVLRGKAEWAGRAVVEVNPRHTSQRCSRCGHVAAGNRVAQAVFRCLSCGHTANADVNAARNILRSGLDLQAARAA